MKNILIIHFNMDLGGAETSLIGLLDSIDYGRYAVDLFLYETKGDLLELIPKQVNLLDEKDEYKALVCPVKSALKSRYCIIGIVRCLSKVWLRFLSFFGGQKHYGYTLKQYYHKFSLPFLSRFKKQYDLAISYNDPHFVLSHKVNANTKIGWFHSDFSIIEFNRRIEEQMWKQCDYAVSVSKACKSAFDKYHPYMADRSLVFENILSKKMLFQRANEKADITFDNSVSLLSIGRFTHAKNFDNVPFICKRILEEGISVKWYLIGYGGDEALIKSNIVEAGVQDNVIILGKTNNPYPFIKKCDIYVQPSRFEGKCVAVREAQILNKPVVITNYATSSSQLTDGFDGIIVPMDVDGCAKGIAQVINDKELQKKLIENTKMTDYSNATEIKKLYRLMEK